VLNLLNKIKALPQQIKEKLQQYYRVLIIARKPDKEEFALVSKVCAEGIALIGFIGFLIYLIAVFLLR